MELTDKQIRFCQEYTIDFNATQAAIRAGYSEDTARSIGSENLTKPDIKEYISELQESAATALKITRERVLNAYGKLAFYDTRKFYNEDGNLLPIPDLDEETAFALTGFEVTEEKGGNGEGQQVTLGYTKKIKMSERKTALDSIAKMLGYNEPDKIKHIGGIVINYNNQPGNDPLENVS